MNNINLLVTVLFLVSKTRMQYVLAKKINIYKKVYGKYKEVRKSLW